MSSPDENTPVPPPTETISPSTDSPTVEENTVVTVEEKITKTSESSPPASEEKKIETPDNNVHFEKEKDFFETNKDSLKNKIASLQGELEEEKKLAESLASKDVADDAELINIQTFLTNNSQEIHSLHNVVTNLNTALKELVKNNKAKQEELQKQSEEYASLINSETARALANKIKNIRTILGQLEDFLVKEGVQGPNSPQ